MSTAVFSFFDLPKRQSKPRHSGLTMVLDKHLGLNAAQDLVDTAGPYIDIVKLGWGSALLYDESLLIQKIALYKSYGIRVCTGGTFMELAFEKNQVDQMLQKAKVLGFDAVEVSNGIHPRLDINHKRALIKKVVSYGFYALSEVGRKLAEEDKAMSIAERVAEVQSDLQAGAVKVIMESRESGSVGIFDEFGKINMELATHLFQQIDPNDIIWEAPKKEQQVWLIHQLGPEANIGNVVPEEAMSLESLRLGIRGDTFRDFLSDAIIVYLELGVSGALRAKRRDDIVVMVDALRASATIIACLEQDAREVVPVVSADELEGEITIGERGGEKLIGATFGNSPVEIKSQNLAGKQVVFSSTNGAECICSAKGDTNQVLIGSVINARIIALTAVEIAKKTGKNITLLAAGRNNLPAIEDRIGVAEILKNIGSPIVRGMLEPHYSEHIERDFLSSESGLNLTRLGYAQDVIYCARLNVSQVVPSYDGTAITRI